MIKRGLGSISKRTSKREKKVARHVEMPGYLPESTEDGVDQKGLLSA